MDCFVVLGASQHQTPMIERAKDLGHKVASFDMNPHAPGLEMADYGFAVNARDPDAVCETLKKEGLSPVGISTMGSDIPDVIAELCDRYRLVGPSKETAALCTDKYLMKVALRDAEICVPDFCEVFNSEEAYDAVFGYGKFAVMKPVDRSGSRGVIRTQNGPTPQGAYDIAKSVSPSGRVMVERELHGIQLSTECLFQNGEPGPVAVVERNYFDPRIDIQCLEPGQVMENGGQMPAPLSEAAMQEARETTVAAGRALGIKNGPCKGDLVWTSQGCFVLEIAARLGGSEMCSRLIPMACGGYEYISDAIRIACGEKARFRRMPEERMAAVRYLFARPGRDLKIEHSFLPSWIRDFRMETSKGGAVRPLASHADRIASFIVVADSYDELWRRIDEAYSKFKVSTTK